MKFREQKQIFGIAGLMLFTFFLGNVFVLASQEDRWKRIGSATNGDTFFRDKSVKTIIQKGLDPNSDSGMAEDKIKQVWVKIVKGNDKGHTLELWEFSCDLRKKLVRQVIRYKADGSVNSEESFSEHPLATVRLVGSDITPNSMGEAVFEDVCE